MGWAEQQVGLAVQAAREVRWRAAERLEPEVARVLGRELVAARQVVQLVAARVAPVVIAADCSTC